MKLDYTALTQPKHHAAGHKPGPPGCAGPYGARGFWRGGGCRDGGICGAICHLPCRGANVAANSAATPPEHVAAWLDAQRDCGSRGRETACWRCRRAKPVPCRITRLEGVLHRGTVSMPLPERNALNSLPLGKWDNCHLPVVFLPGIPCHVIVRAGRMSAPGPRSAAFWVCTAARR